MITFPGQPSSGPQSDPVIAHATKPGLASDGRTADSDFDPADCDPVGIGHPAGQGESQAHGPTGQANHYACEADGPTG